MNLKNTRLVNLLGVFLSFFFIAFVAVFLWAPAVGTHAEMRWDDGWGYTRSRSDVKISVGTMLAIRVDKNELNMEASVGSFAQGSVTIDVSSNSQYGYTLSLEDVDTNTNLVSSSSSEVISSNYVGSKTSSTMSDNSWGFSIDSTNFYAVPVVNDPITLKRTADAMDINGFDSTVVDFGAKVGMHLTAGTYEDDVLFTAYVNGLNNDPKDGSKTRDLSDNGGDFSGITKMQEMTHSLCSRVAIGDRTNLIDTRDGKEYPVEKMLDGRCWMVKNLEVAGVTAKPTDSDVTKDFVIPESDINSFNGSQTTLTALAYVDETYGGYYNFYTATAGTGVDTSHSSYDDYNITPTESICPKGWKLPVSDEMARLRDSYGGYWGSDLQESINAFLPGGYVTYGHVIGAGDYGAYWSASANDWHDAGRWYVYVDKYSGIYNYINASFYDGYYGDNMRCVAK